MEMPISKYISEDYRNILKTSGSPSRIDTDKEIVPTISLNSGIPMPSSNQRLRYATISIDATAREYNIITKGNDNMYYLGHHVINLAAVVLTGTLYDAGAGAPAGITAPNVYNDNLGHLALLNQPAVIGSAFVNSLTNPIKLIRGVRFSGGGVGQSGILIIYYMEEYLN
jgi:hypothetical protein